ncbi:MAG: fructose PTS transporter subunit IIA [Coriobacteriales bacterium]|nr:fructose PTS transporter subunit IIA [Coriobacteriales bacterium]
MSELVKKVFFDNPAKNTAEAIDFLAAQAVELGISDDKDAVLAAFNEREAQGPTGMTGGFALPHAKTAAIKEAAIVVVKFADIVEWKSMDESAVKAAIAIYMPEGEAATTHLAVLAQVAALLMQPAFCELVLSSDDAAEITAAIEEGLE